MFGVGPPQEGRGLSPLLSISSVPGIPVLINASALMELSTSPTLPEVGDN